MKVIGYLLASLLCLPVICFAQFTISGNVINHADKKPLGYVNVFLNNASVGDQTDEAGRFMLRNAKSGKYELIVSFVGFETYKQNIVVNNDNLVLPTIEINPKTTALKEVTISSKKDPNREQYFEWFKTEFLGTTPLAADCKIMNSEVLDLEYDENKALLTASTDDFLIVENRALGYKVKYLVNSFSKNSKTPNNQTIHYEGSVLFEELKGSAAQLKRWRKARLEAYRGSEMHFLRSLLNDRLEQNGFRVLQYALFNNPERPPDSVIKMRIKSFKSLRSKQPRYKDSLTYWEKKAKLVRSYRILESFNLTRSDLIMKTDQDGIYALGCNFDALYITYNKDKQFSRPASMADLNNRFNQDVTLVSFAEPYAFFSAGGNIFNINSVVLSGVWTRSRVAGLLPVDYEVKGEEN